MKFRWSVIKCYQYLIADSIDKLSAKKDNFRTVGSGKCIVLRFREFTRFPFVIE